jgi:hypothetical protein
MIDLRDPTDVQLIRADYCKNPRTGEFYDLYDDELREMWILAGYYDDTTRVLAVYYRHPDTRRRGERTRRRVVSGDVRLCTLTPPTSSP